MALEIYTDIDLEQNQLMQPVLHKLASAPASPVEGQVYYDTTTHDAFFWNGTMWVPFNQAASKFAATIGDGIALAYPVTHNLGTLDTVESVFAVASGLEEIAAIQHTSPNVTTFTFSVPPVLNSVRVVIHA